ncbi:TPA: WGR domain-containing protein [Legionella pneumophila]|uniref:WGR domain-containing protein n=1 Tax=Legionella bozemanae TaxID=447 RepID=A0A0W0RES0_LEGBO|nr:WGR domain-containing protein [Legionella bozemanae]KTC69583.1 hypothetical protein Lboz_3099 [Legionella bozemanae]STP13861.1 Uncharacterised protein [Legionella bozemanae]HAT1722191.1 WGR domain-containing protein [Legionella pneumophila]
MYLFNSFWLIHLHLPQAPYHYIRFEKESRYYELRVSQDLLGDWTLSLSNGRINSKLGTTRVQAFSYFDDALAAFYQAIKLRLQRKYHATQYLIDHCLFSLVFSLMMTKYGKPKKPPKTNKKTITENSKTKQSEQLIGDSLQASFFS